MELKGGFSMKKPLKILLPAAVVAVALILLIVVTQLLPEAGFPDDSVEAQFLRSLLTFDAKTLDELGEPSEAYAEHLKKTVGDYCTQEVLVELLAARFPFSLMEEGVSSGMKRMQITPLDPETSGEGRCEFIFESKDVRFSGRLTKDASSGKITDCSINIDR